MSRLGIVIPVGKGREDNLHEVLKVLNDSYRAIEEVVVILDGFDEIVPEGGYIPCLLPSFWIQSLPIAFFHQPKHHPGMEQPRNIGARYLKNSTHVWFLDSDVVPGLGTVEMMKQAVEESDQESVIVSPYDWLPPGMRPGDLNFFSHAPQIMNDPRWNMFKEHVAGTVYQNDLSKGLGCFSGNLVWPIDEFQRVGGFWSEIHHGRCEDGELGLRAVAMGVNITLAPTARGFHLWHEENVEWKIKCNERDVPMLNKRHPWVEGSDIFMVDRDGKAFDVKCSGCGELIPTINWWQHVPECGVSPVIEARL